MSQTEQKSIILKFFDEYWNKFNVDFLDEVTTPDFTHHDNAATRNRKEYKELFVSARANFPENESIPEDIFTSRDKVAVRWTWRGVQKGGWSGIEAKGKRVELPAISIFTFKGNKISEIWSCWDTALLRR